MKSLLLFCFVQFLLLSAFGQEKRLALVIGNANYDKGTLKNPVNDALLMKETLEKLNFEVILDTNLRTRTDLLNSINLFGEKRKNYSVGFVYYAGHGVQIDGNNYILATKEKYDSKINVKDNGVNVDRFLEYFELAKNEINILILDACRNNPFEKNWTTSSRSLDDGLGLAPLSSSGNIIAFSTSAGTTASDGNEKVKNSSYCLSLVKNMMTPDLDLDQIFRNVRKEVREISGGNQLPTVDNHYEGSDFYFRKSTYTDQIIQIDSLISKENYDLALEKVSIVLAKSPSNKQALLRRGRIEYNSENRNYDGFHLFKADSLYPNDQEVTQYLARFYATIGDKSKAINKINLAIKLDGSNPDNFMWRAVFYSEQNKQVEALEDYNKAIELDAKNGHRYYQRAEFYLTIKKEYDNALLDYSKAIELNPTNLDYLYARGYLHAFFLKKNNHALDDFEQILQIDPKNVDAINLIGNILEEEGKYDLAIGQYEKGITLEKINPQSAAFCYSNRADIYVNQGKFEDAFNDYTNAINYSINKSEFYYKRHNLLLDFKKDEIGAMNDLNEAIRLDPENTTYLYARGILWMDNMKNHTKAIEDWNKVLEIDPSSTDAINAIGTVYVSLGDTLKAIEQFNKGIINRNQSPEAAAFCYGNRADLYAQMGKLTEAENDYSTAINLSASKTMHYYSRALFYYDTKNDLNACLKDLDMAIKLDPLNINYLNGRGVILRELKKYDKAILDFEQILQIDPENIDAINSIGNILEEEEKYDLAKAQYYKGIALEKNNPQTAAYCYVNRAGIYEKEGKLELALADYSKAIELDSKNAFWYYSKGAFLENFMNKPYDALVDYTMAIYLDSMEISYWWSRGKLFSEKLNNQEIAIQNFDQILKILPNDVNASNWKSIFYSRNNEISKAIEGYQKIISMGDSIKKLDNKIEDYGWANINLAEIYQCEEKIDDALSLYNEGVSYISEYPESYYWRAWFFALYMSKYDEAIKDFSTSIKLEPKNPYWLLNRSKIYQIKGDIKSAKNDLNEAVKISNESAIYISERGNFYSTIGDHEKSIKDFQNAFKLDSLNRRLYHYITEDLIRQGKSEDAIESAKYAINIFNNDTVSFEQLGRIYFAKNDLYKSLSSYSQAASIMEFNEGDRTIYPHDIQVFLSDIHLKIAEIYKKLNQSDLECEALSKAKDIVIFETRPDRQKMIKEIHEKLKYCQN